MQSEVGKQIRDARNVARLTINEVAQRSDFSPSYVSQVEREMANPSLSALSRIAEAVGLDLADLFSSNDASSPTPKISPDESIPTGVVRHDHRKELIHPGSKLRFELLCPDLQHALQVHKTTAPPGMNMSEHITHEGEECAVVLRGEMQFTVGDDSFFLETGDSIYFDGRKPHFWVNTGQADLEVMWIITPPHF